MNVNVERKFKLEVVYNGLTKPIEVEFEEQVRSVLQKAITAFGITQNPHLLSLFRENGSLVPENESVERAGLRPDEVLLLRPNAVKGGHLLRLPREILGATLRTLRECGRGECECVAYWTGPTEQDLADGLEHPAHKRSPYGYEVDDSWLTEFWRRLARSRRSVKAQLHTHPGLAFHSATDDQWPIVSQAGFLSIVIPNFAAGQASLDEAWIGRLEANGMWNPLANMSEAVSLA